MEFYKVFQICTVAHHYWSVLLPLSLSFTIRGRIWQSSCNVRRQALSLGAGMWSHLPFFFFGRNDPIPWLLLKLHYCEYNFCKLVSICWPSELNKHFKWTDSVGLRFALILLQCVFVCLFFICLLESTKDREETDIFQVHVRHIAKSFL